MLLVASLRKRHAYISVMKPIAHSTSLSVSAPAAQPRHGESTLVQGITLLRVVAALLTVYIKFKIVLWLSRGSASHQGQ